MSIVPDGRSRASAAYTFPTFFDALRQHAAIVTALREAGWSVVSYGSTPPTPERRPLRGALAA